MAQCSRPFAPPGQPFPETGFQVAEPFLGFWKGHSGAQLFGNPVSPRINEPGANGENLNVQYFERARFELHPGAGAQSDIALGKLGLEVPVSGTIANPLPEGLQGEQVDFKEVGISVPKKFSDFWGRNGGAAIFGNPMTPVLTDSSPDGKQLAVQYFERARFEY